MSNSNPVGEWYQEGPQKSQLQPLLCALEQRLSRFLDDLNFVDEVKRGQPDLLQYLAKNPQIVVQLLTYIVEEPTPLDEDKRIHKWPFLSCQVIESGQPAICDILLQPQHLAFLFSFLNTNINSLLAGYFLRAVTTLANYQLLKVQDFALTPEIVTLLLKASCDCKIAESLKLLLLVETLKQSQSRAGPKTQALRLLFNFIAQKEAEESQIQNLLQLLEQSISKHWMWADSAQLLDQFCKGVPLLLAQRWHSTRLNCVLYRVLTQYTKCIAGSSAERREQFNKEAEAWFSSNNDLPSPGLLLLAKVELLGNLVLLGSSGIVAAAVESGLVGRMLSLFFEQQEQSLLMELIVKFMEQVFASQHDRLESLREHIFLSLDIIRKTLLADLEYSRPAYCYYLRLVKAYSSLKNASPRILDHISACSGLWNSFSKQILEPYNKRLKIELGTLDPQEFKELDSASVKVSTVPKKATSQHFLPCQLTFDKVEGKSQEHTRPIQSHFPKEQTSQPIAKIVSVLKEIDPQQILRKCQEVKRTPIILQPVVTGRRASVSPSPISKRQKKKLWNCSEDSKQYRQIQNQTPQAKDSEASEPCSISQEKDSQVKPTKELESMSEGQPQQSEGQPQQSNGKSGDMSDIRSGCKAESRSEQSSDSKPEEKAESRSQCGARQKGRFGRLRIRVVRGQLPSNGTRKCNKKQLQVLRLIGVL